jgi:hypothetical protein
MFINCGEGSAFDEYYSGYTPSEPKYKNTHKETEQEKKNKEPDSGGMSPDSN